MNSLLSFGVISFHVFGVFLETWRVGRHLGYFLLLPSGRPHVFPSSVSHSSLNHRFRPPPRYRPPCLLYSCTNHPLAYADGHALNLRFASLFTLRYNFGFAGFMPTHNIIQIKCPVTRLIVPGEVPRHYLPQLQISMHILGLDSADFFEWQQGQTNLVNVKRDQAYIDAMLPKLRAFYTEWQTLKREGRKPKRKRKVDLPFL